jgi:DNA-binding CsgD family transcriptional regulator
VSEKDDAREGCVDGADFEFDGVRYRYLAFDDTPSPAATGLTSAEFEVAWRAATCQSRKEIAEARGTSKNTVTNQLASAFAKLGVSSRGELALALRA